MRCPTYFGLLAFINSNRQLCAILYVLTRFVDEVSLMWTLADLKAFEFIDLCRSNGPLCYFVSTLTRPKRSHNQ